MGKACSISMTLAKLQGYALMHNLYKFDGLRTEIHFPDKKYNPPEKNLETALATLCDRAAKYVMNMPSKESKKKRNYSKAL